MGVLIADDPIPTIPLAKRWKHEFPPQTECDAIQAGPRGTHAAQLKRFPPGESGTAFADEIPRREDGDQFSVMA